MGAPGHLELFQTCLSEKKILGKAKRDYSQLKDYISHLACVHLGNPQEALKYVAGINEVSTDNCQERQIKYVTEL